MRILITLSILIQAFAIACVSRTKQNLYNTHLCRTLHPTESESASQTDISTPRRNRFTHHWNAAAVELHMAILQTFLWEETASDRMQRKRIETSPNVIA